MKEHATFYDLPKHLTFQNLDIEFLSIDHIAHSLESGIDVTLCTKRYESGELPGVFSSSVEIEHPNETHAFRTIKAVMTINKTPEAKKIGAFSYVENILLYEYASTLFNKLTTNRNVPYFTLLIPNQQTVSIHVTEINASEIICSIEADLSVSESGQNTFDEIVNIIEAWGAIQSSASSVALGSDCKPENRSNIIIGNYEDHLPAHSETYDLWLSVITSDPRIYFDSDKFAAINYDEIDFDALGIQYGFGEDIRTTLAEVAKANADFDKYKGRKVGLITTHDIGTAITLAMKKRTSSS